MRHLAVLKSSLLLLAIETGLRAAELTALNVADIPFGEQYATWKADRANATDRSTTGSGHEIAYCGSPQGAD